MQDVYSIGGVRFINIRTCDLYRKHSWPDAPAAKHANPKTQKSVRFPRLQASPFGAGSDQTFDHSRE